MTTPIRTVLATLPSGEVGLDLTDAELGKYFRDHCNRDVDKKREFDHKLRDVLFCDGGVEEMCRRVDTWFEHETNRIRVKRMLSDSRFSNITKRIVTEMSTVYAEPATRSVGGSDENQQRYADLSSAMQLDEENERVNQQYNLHRAVIVFPRVRTNGEVVLDVHSAATARAVMHPQDNTLVVGWLTRLEHRSVRNLLTKPVAWQLTTDHEYEYLDAEFMPIPGTHIAHGLGVNPGIPITSGARSTPDFWPGEEGADITAGHITQWMTEALMVKETKTATKQPVFSGDGTTMARNQVLDSGGVIETPEGTSVITIDIGTEVDTFLKSADHTLERVANNSGMSLAGLKHQGVQSAEAHELMLAPVRERRKKQVKKFRSYERLLAVVLAAVLAKYAPDRAFDPTDWSIDFGEPQVLLTKKDRLEIFEKERSMGLDNTVAFLMRENPDLSFEQAKAQILENIELETWRVASMRDLQAMSGAMGTPVPDGTAPTAHNLATGQPPFSTDGAATAPVQADA